MVPRVAVRARRSARTGRAELIPQLLYVQVRDIEERDDPARARLPALELPWERPDHAPGVQYPVDVAAHVLGVDAPAGEGEVVHREQVLGDLPAAEVVGVVVLAEVLCRGHADLALEARGDVRAHLPDRRVDRVIT